MSDTIDVNTKEFEKIMKWFIDTAPKRLIPDTARGYVNDMAFETKKATVKTMDKVFDYKNNSSRKYLESAVHVQKAKASTTISNIVSEVGVRSGNEKSHKFKKREILTRQEKGGEVKQLTSRGGAYRKQLMLPGGSENAKKVIRFRKTGIVSATKKISNKKRRMAAAFKVARDKNKKYASTPYGIYRVLNRRARMVRTYKDPGTVTTPKQPWLDPASKISMQRKDRIFIKNFNRQLKKYKFK